ncbi:hypothetical protein [Salinicoccus halitifaciens]|uniref:Uncharacterized protein n=1 Tax=Salinicoccus halitifaciens TaxID=1073415 RepID=A0ABV2E702_9STAP|nr:hypothetical protein [Salinicoccus halitifaciens]MCD2136743.1 hypothetical protein [Salinicoccus halitifaciens]
MALENMYINEKGTPLKHLEQHGESCRSEALSGGAFVEAEGFRSWEEYLDSIDLVRQISRKTS